MSIQISHATKRFGAQHVVDDVSLDIADGELFVLLGPSGSGKSTLLRMIAGLTSADGGSIVLHGRDVTSLPPQKRGTGFVFQNYALFPNMTVEENIAFGLDVQRVPKAQRQARVAELLDIIDMTELGERLPAQLSGGQQQRVAVARALAANPAVLLLDEPFGALDVKIRSQLRRSLRQIQRRLKFTAILVTHDQEEAFELADRIGIIDNGKLLEVGTPDQLYRTPRHRFTAGFLGAANLFPAHRNGTTVHIGEITIPAPAGTDHLSGQPVELLLRPESIDLALSPGELTSAPLGTGTVTGIAFAGAFERVIVTTPRGELTALLTPEQARKLAVRPGDTVWLGVRDVHLLALS
ncbi:MAG: ABC transporter ATP-binding protein [Chloroflexi bacterium]|nr:ABC transporter ATP-binding protein [Chloroflexota bacterium]